MPASLLIAMSIGNPAMYQPLLPFSDPRPVSAVEPKGVVYTKPWVVELLLDLAGYSSESNLVDALAIEPAAGEGAFLIPMALRLVASCIRQNRPIFDCESSLIAYELDDESAEIARRAVANSLEALRLARTTADRLAAGWVRAGDYLLEVGSLPRADYVIGNPPYVRLESIPAETAGLYRDAYPTMRGRADLYVAFFEAGLRQLEIGGVCAYICADRWMLNQYGADLRRLVTQRYGVEMVVEMHGADAFDDDVSAYPAMTVIRKGPQAQAVVASIGPGFDSSSGSSLAACLRSVAGREPRALPQRLKAAVVERWFTGSDPWPSGPPARLALLRRLEEHFRPLESNETGTKVGIGVATGLDQVFITKDADLVESDRLLPLAMAHDTASGQFLWSGHYLVNPWKAEGLVELKRFPRLNDYLEKHQNAIKKRNTAKRNPHGWYRTIDRVNMSLIGKAKLYVHDIKDCFNPVLDTGRCYPHHNLYFILSDRWDVEVLGGLLLSSVGQLFIEAYGVRMRGGYLRFQAQYLRRIRVPEIKAVLPDQADRLIKAFRSRDRRLATEVALEVYHITESEMRNAH